jgi:hypothetical protein
MKNAVFWDVTLILSTLMMEAIYSSETSVLTAARRHIPENSILHTAQSLEICLSGCADHSVGTPDRLADCPCSPIHSLKQERNRTKRGTDRREASVFFSRLSV